MMMRRQEQWGWTQLVTIQSRKKVSPRKLLFGKNLALQSTKTWKPWPPPLILSHHYTNLITLIHLIILQHDALNTKKAGGLPTNFKLLPQYLNDLGYASYMVGKCVAQRLQNCAVLLSQYQSVLSGGTWATAMKSTFHRTGGSTTFMDFMGAAKIIGVVLFTWDALRPMDLQVCMYAVHISKFDCDASISLSALFFNRKAANGI